MKVEKVKMEYEDLVSILADANYSLPWCRFHRESDKEWTEEELRKAGKKDSLDICIEDELAADLVSGGSIIVEDVFDDEFHSVTVRDFEVGFAKASREYPEAASNFMKEVYDINDVDILLQTAVFNDFVYDC